MKTQHTPGTWFAEDRFIRNIEGQLIAEVQECHQFEVQCQDGTLDIGEEEMPWKANARLIAAAPELLEMVNRLSKSLTRTNDHDQRLYLEAKEFIAELTDE